MMFGCKLTFNLKVTIGKRSISDDALEGYCIQTGIAEEREGGSQKVSDSTVILDCETKLDEDVKNYSRLELVNVRITEANDENLTKNLIVEDIYEKLNVNILEATDSKIEDDGNLLFYTFNQIDQECKCKGNSANLLLKGSFSGTSEINDEQYNIVTSEKLNAICMLKNDPSSNAVLSCIVPYKSKSGFTIVNQESKKIDTSILSIDINDNTPLCSTTDKNTSSSGLSGGAISGIVVSVVVVAVVVVGIISWTVASGTASSAVAASVASQSSVVPISNSGITSGAKIGSLA